MAATSSPAGSSASTTSASSIAVRRCRPADRWSRRTAPPGWRSTARTCSRSRSSCPMRIPVYEEHAFKFLQNFMWIAYAMDRIGDHRRRDVGRGGRLLLRRAAPARRVGPAPQGPVDGRPAAALCLHHLRAEQARVRTRGSWSSSSCSASGTRRSSAGGPDRHRIYRARRPAPAVDADQGAAGAGPRLPAGRERVPQPVRHQVTVEGRTRSTRSSSTPAGRRTRCRTCRRNRIPACSAATRTGAGRSGCRSTG